jgi:cell division protein FtsB
MHVGKYKLTGITVINGLGVAFVLYLVIVLAGTVKSNYDLGRQVNQLTAQQALLQAQKDQLSYQIKYYGTTSYQERQAHAQLNLQVPGETEVVLPSSAPATTPTPAVIKKALIGKSNFAQWLVFLGGAN